MTKNSVYQSLLLPPPPESPPPPPSNPESDEESELLHDESELLHELSLLLPYVLPERQLNLLLLEIMTHKKNKINDPIHGITKSITAITDRIVFVVFDLFDFLFKTKNKINNKALNT